MNTARPNGRNRSCQVSVVSRNKTTVTDGWQNPIRDPREEALPQMGIVDPLPSPDRDVDRNGMFDVNLFAIVFEDENVRPRARVM